MNRFLKLAAVAAAAAGLGFAALAATGHAGMDHSGAGGMAGMGSMSGMGHRMGTGMGMGGGMGPGRGAMTGGPTAMLTQQDANSAADMGVVHDLLANNTKIRRNVTQLADGIRTVTESDDAEVAKSIQVHVASMSQRLQDGREFNIFSDTLPVLFENRDKIVSKVEMTPQGAVVTRTSTDAKVVAALQGHSAEVTELVQDGMQAMRRGMMSRMAMNSGSGRDRAMRGASEHRH
jgi:hypothetical protein